MADEKKARDSRVRDVNLARTFAVYEDEGYNIARQNAAQQDKKPKK